MIYGTVGGKFCKKKVYLAVITAISRFRGRYWQSHYHCHFVLAVRKKCVSLNFGTAVVIAVCIGGAGVEPIGISTVVGSTVVIINFIVVNICIIIVTSGGIAIVA